MCTIILIQGEIEMRFVKLGEELLNNKETKRLAMNVPAEVHNQLKLMSIKYNINMTDYVVRVLVERLDKEKDYDRA